MSDFNGARVRVGGATGLAGGGVTTGEVDAAIDAALAALSIPTVLDDLADCRTTGTWEPNDGDIWRYNGPAEQWEPYTLGSTTITVGGSFLIDGGGSAIASGVKGDLEVPFAGTIKRIRVFQDQSGSIAVSGWKDTLANYPPLVADLIYTVTISSSATPGDSGAVSIAVAAGDIIRHNINSTATSITRVTVAYTIERQV